jgi:hypothetical protein
MTNHVDVAVQAEGDPNRWPDLADKIKEGKVIDLMGQRAPVLRMLLFTEGMKDAAGKTKASVVLRVDLPDGRIVIAETSCEAFKAAAAAIIGMEAAHKERTWVDKQKFKGEAHAGSDLRAGDRAEATVVRGVPPLAGEPAAPGVGDPPPA